MGLSKTGSLLVHPRRDDHKHSHWIALEEEKCIARTSMRETPAA
jgi:hypothetical protein